MSSPSSKLAGQATGGAVGVEDSVSKLLAIAVFVLVTTLQSNNLLSLKSTTDQVLIITQ
jgi:hypothetical protein